MIRIVFLLCFCSYTVLLGAQSDRYFLQEFVPGAVYYGEGTVVKGTLNYNLLTERIELKIDDKLTAINRLEDIEYIGLELNKFVRFESNFGRILVDGDKALLVAKYGVDVVKSPGTKGISKHKLNSLIESGQNIPDGISLEINTTYYLVRQEEPTSGFYLSRSKFEKAELSGFNKIFSVNKKEINMFVKANNINFSDKEDLEKLTKYCESLN